MISDVALQIVEAVFSKADDLCQCVENRCINIIFHAGYVFVVPHQEDTVEWNSQHDTQFIDLKGKMSFLISFNLSWQQ